MQPNKRLELTVGRMAGTERPPAAQAQCCADLSAERSE